MQIEAGEHRIDRGNGKEGPRLAYMMIKSVTLPYGILHPPPYIPTANPEAEGAMMDLDGLIIVGEELSGRSSIHVILFVVALFHKKIISGFVKLAMEKIDCLGT